MHAPLSRRSALFAASGAALAAALPAARAQDAKPKSATKSPFILCLNTATIMGQKLTLPQQIDVAIKAGYQAIEPWIRDIEAFAKTGGSLDDVRKKLSDAGMTVESAIGFAPWIVDDEEKRKAGLEQARREMDLAARIGATRIAAPPVGATDRVDMRLDTIAQRYRALCEVGDQTGVVPMVELWGHSKTLTRLSEAAYVALESRHPKACILADVFHLYKGGSDPAGLHLLSAGAVPAIHVNDYPNVERNKVTDGDRTMPGEGVAPLTQILKQLAAMGGPCVLSLEIFNRQYWKLDALVCAQTGIDKVKAAVEKALA